MSKLDEMSYYYAEELRALANLQSATLVRAFTKVPREHSSDLGHGKYSVPDSEANSTTKNADPTHLYHDLLVDIDAKRHLNNGSPSFLLFNRWIATTGSRTRGPHRLRPGLLQGDHGRHRRSNRSRLLR